MIFHFLPWDSSPFRLHHHLAAYFWNFLEPSASWPVAKSKFLGSCMLMATRNPKQPPGMVLKPVVNNGISTTNLPQLVAFSPDFERTINSMLLIVGDIMVDQPLFLGCFRLGSSNLLKFLPLVSKKGKVFGSLETCRGNHRGNHKEIIAIHRGNYREIHSNSTVNHRGNHRETIAIHRGNHRES